MSTTTTRPFVLTSVCALPLFVACHRDPPAPTVSSDPNQRLAELVRSQDNPVHFEANGGETLWTDGVFIERAAAFPAPIQSLRDHPPNVTPPPIDTTSSPALHDAVDIPGLIETFDAQQSALLLCVRRIFDRSLSERILSHPRPARSDFIFGWRSRTRSHPGGDALRCPAWRVRETWTLTARP